MPKGYDFDKVIKRKGTDSIKFDEMKAFGVPEDVIPMWVADMDFVTAKPVVDAMVARVKHGIFGYSSRKADYYRAVALWMIRHHNWEPAEEWLVTTPGVVFAISMAIRSLTEPGDAILIQEPVYYPFRRSIEQNGRQVVNNPLVLGDDGIYHMNFDEMEELIIKNHVKMMIMCSPHNPVGRVWTPEELEKVGNICLKHQVLVVADEIHQDFVYEGFQHTVFASLRPEFSKNCITCTAASKTFNLAGMQVSNIWIEDETLRNKFKTEIEKIGYDEMNALGLIATKTAYQAGEPWLEKLSAYLAENLEYLKTFLAENTPKIKLIEPQGTYLVWLDMRELGMSVEEQKEFMLTKAKVWGDSGRMFGENGAGFERLNIACPRKTLTKALKQLKKAYDSL